jgi:hypothetical protein
MSVTTNLRCVTSQKRGDIIITILNCTISHNYRLWTPELRLDHRAHTILCQNVSCVFSHDIPCLLRLRSNVLHRIHNTGWTLRGSNPWQGVKYSSLKVKTHSAQLLYTDKFYYQPLQKVFYAPTCFGYVL